MGKQELDAVALRRSAFRREAFGLIGKNGHG